MNSKTLNVNFQITVSADTNGEVKINISQPSVTPLEPINDSPPLFSDYTESEKQTLNILKNIPNYPFDFTKDIEFVRKLLTDYPSINLLEEVEKYSTWLLDHPLKKRSNPRLTLRNWCAKSYKWQQEKGGGQSEGRYGQQQSDFDADLFI